MLIAVDRCSMKITTSPRTVGTCLALLIASLSSTTPLLAAESSAPHRLGVGYKIGNGLGFLGADLVAGLTEHLTLGLQANYFAVQSGAGETAKGYGVVPFAQYRFFAPGSSPYVSAGPLYLRLKLNDVTASATGGVANGGWEWIWSSGISINLGAGVSYLRKLTVTDGFTTVERDGGLNFNIEAALRFYFY